MIQILRKTLGNGAVKDVSGRTVTGYFASWGEPVGDQSGAPIWIDSDGDVFAPDAFDKTIKQNGPEGANRIWHLNNHNFGAAINKPKTLTPDKTGLYFETVFPDTTLANDLIKLYDAGAITEHSVAFNIIQARNEQKGLEQYQLIQEARMWEGSSVLWGANERTPFTGFKAEEAEAHIKLLDSLMHNGTFSDETFLMIEKALHDIKKIFSGPGAPDPQNTESDTGEPDPDPATIGKSMVAQLTQFINEKNKKP